jgi:hypothetical protein
MTTAVGAPKSKIDWDTEKAKVETKKDKKKIKKDFDACVDKNRKPAIVCLTTVSQSGFNVSQIIIPPLLKGIVAAQCPEQAKTLNPAIDKGSKTVFTCLKGSSKPAAKCTVDCTSKIMKRSFGSSVETSACCDGSKKV